MVKVTRNWSILGGSQQTKGCLWQHTCGIDWDLRGWSCSLHPHFSVRKALCAFKGSWFPWYDFKQKLSFTISHHRSPSHTKAHAHMWEKYICVVLCMHMIFCMCAVIYVCMNTNVYVHADTIYLHGFWERDLGPCRVSMLPTEPTPQPLQSFEGNYF